ncbi:MAG: ferritin [Treponema sp.]|jgi:ferritin|nr:ferritin [Treponema sp.]
MLSETLTKALSDQVNAEYYSAYLYLGMSAYADREGCKGIANWLFVQAREEMAHAVRLYQHILERGAFPVFADIKAPPVSFAGIKDVFEKVLAHERGVTARINNIASLAVEEKDHATYNFILWYVNEQIEEEKSVDEIVARINLMGDSPSLLFHLDSELAARTYTGSSGGGSA